MKFSIGFVALLLLVGAGCSPAVVDGMYKTGEAEELHTEDTMMPETSADEMDEATTSFAAVDGTVVYTNTAYGFSFSFPETWVYTEEHGGDVILDPPGEGPNPYSDETGERTNPMDDVVVAVREIEDIVEYLENDIASGSTADAKPLLIDGHKANAYSSVGMVEEFTYVVEIGDGKYVLVYGADDMSEDVAAVALSLTFEE